MTCAARHYEDIQREIDRPDNPVAQRRSRPRRTAVTSALLALAISVAGCGGSKSPGGGGGSTSDSSSQVLAKYEAYARCMRSRGILDFPDPSTAGGGIAFNIHRSPGSDLDPTNSKFQAAKQSCQSLLPSGLAISHPSSEKLAAELKWAQCMRDHGLSNFPDPNAQGAFDRNQIDENSPAFEPASNDCKSLNPGPTPVAP